MERISRVHEILLPVYRAYFFVKRLLEIKSVVLFCIFRASGSRPYRFRLFFERAGGAFIKLGQILAMRHDFLPPEYTEELLELLSRVPEEPWRNMSAVFVEEMGESPNTFFQSISEKPIASASIGQVYRATMKDGKDVAVKIGRPGVKDRFENDFVLAAFIGEVIGIFTFATAIPVHDVVSEFISSTRAELNFLNEGQNAALILENSELHTGVVIPAPYLEYSTERVLIMEFLPDVLLADEVMRKLGKGDGGYREKLKNEGMDLVAISYIFIIDLLRQYFIDHVFHADPHPGNVFFQPNDKVGFFDFGIVGRAPEDIALSARIHYAIAHRDIYGTGRGFLCYAKKIFEEELAMYRKAGKAKDEKYDKVLIKIEEIMADNFAIDLSEILNPWYDAIDEGANREGSGGASRAKSASIMFSKIIIMARQYNVVLPREIVLFFRCLSIADMVALRLNPSFDMMRAIQMFFHEFPLSRIEERSELAKQKVGKDVVHVPIMDQSYEGLIELRQRDEERLSIAKERLAEMIAYYTERYPEVRSILKE